MQHRSGRIDLRHPFPLPATPGQTDDDANDIGTCEQDRIGEERQQRDGLTGREDDREDHGDPENRHGEDHPLTHEPPCVLPAEAKRAGDMRPDPSHAVD